jgi:putative DNA primase/helicase
MMVLRLPWLPEKGLAMIYSPRGTGKTLLALTSAYSIATGSGFLDFKVPTSRRVLYIDGEMPAQTMQERLATIVAGFENQPPDPSYFRMLSGDLTEGGLPDLGTVEGQAEFDAQIGDAEIIFADNISTLVRSGKENEAEGWALVQEWGCAIAGADVQSSLCIMQARTACSAAHRSARMCWTR